MMRRVRWPLWIAGVFVLALLALFPLRPALQIAGAERSGLAARAVAGTVWNGAMGDVRLRHLRLGDFSVSLNPLALLTGSANLHFTRFKDSDGPLTGELRSGHHTGGVAHLKGRVAAAGLFGQMPLDALEFSDTTILFRDGHCARAEGTMTAMLGQALGALDLSPDMRGQWRCDGDRARIVLSAGAGQQADFLLAASGRYQIQMRIASRSGEQQVALGLFGFHPRDDAMVLTTNGQL